MSTPEDNQGGSQVASFEQPGSTPGFQQLAASQIHAPRQATMQSLYRRNSTTFTAIGVVVAYLILADATGIVLLGIFPVLLAYRAFQRRELLAPLAAVAAGGALVFSLVLSRH